MLDIVFIIRGILNSWARPSTKTTKIGSPRIKSISQYAKFQLYMSKHVKVQKTVNFQYSTF